MKKLIIVFIIFLCFILIGCQKEYNVTYDLNGGYYDEDNTKDIFGLPIPKKDDYIFIGWQNEGKYINVIDKDLNLVAKWEAKFDYEYINDEEILTQNEETYYVYLMRDGCSWCEKTKEDILRYQYKQKEDQYSKIERLYVINLQTQGYTSPILRTYENEDGFYLVVEIWNDLYIPSTPTLLEISEENGKRTIKLIANGSTDIKNALSRSLISEIDYSKSLLTYEINYDTDGGELETYQTIFNQYQNVLLPIPKKEGFCFSGWYEGDELINKVESRNYNLKAHWVEMKDVVVLEEKDIYNGEKDIYIYFLKEKDIDDDTNEVIKIYNAIASANNLPLIYYVFLDKCEIIYRGYYESDVITYHIDGVTTIDDLYILKRKTLIKITNGVSSYILDENKELKNYFENETGINFSDSK